MATMDASSFSGTIGTLYYLALVAGSASFGYLLLRITWPDVRLNSTREKLGLSVVVGAILTIAAIVLDYAASAAAGYPFSQGFAPLILSTVLVLAFACFRAFFFYSRPAFLTVGIPIPVPMHGPPQQPAQPPKAAPRAIPLPQEPPITGVAARLSEAFKAQAAQKPKAPLMPFFTKQQPQMQPETPQKAEAPKPAQPAAPLAPAITAAPTAAPSVAQVAQIVAPIQKPEEKPPQAPTPKALQGVPPWLARQAKPAPQATQAIPPIPVKKPQPPQQAQPQVSIPIQQPTPAQPKPQIAQPQPIPAQKSQEQIREEKMELEIPLRTKPQEQKPPAAAPSPAPKPAPLAAPLAPAITATPTAAAPEKKQVSPSAQEIYLARKEIAPAEKLMQLKKEISHEEQSIEIDVPLKKSQGTAAAPIPSIAASKDEVKAELKKVREAEAEAVLTDIMGGPLPEGPAQQPQPSGERVRRRYLEAAQGQSVRVIATRNVAAKEEFNDLVQDVYTQLKATKTEDSLKSTMQVGKPEAKAAPQTPQKVTMEDLFGEQKGEAAKKEGESSALFDQLNAISTGHPAAQEEKKPSVEFVKIQAEKGMGCPTCHSKNTRIVFCPYCGTGMCANCSPKITPKADYFIYLCPKCLEEVTVKKKTPAATTAPEAATA